MHSASRINDFIGEEMVRNVSLIWMMREVQKKSSYMGNENILKNRKRKVPRVNKFQQI